MKRFQDWPTRLHDYLQSALRRPFDWGSHDCALHVCNAVLAITGVDMAADFRLSYSNVGAAAKAMRAYAGGGLEDLVDKMAAAHALKEISPKLARRGDVVLFDTEHGATLGIVGLDGATAHAVGMQGATGVPVLKCRRAWRV
jgi:hypothetical protein